MLCVVKALIINWFKSMWSYSINDRRSCTKNSSNGYPFKVGNMVFGSFSGKSPKLFLLLAGTYMIHEVVSEYLPAGLS